MLTAANCQLLSGLDGQSIVSGGTQYVLVPVNTGVQSSAVRIAPYLQRQAYSIAAPAPQIIQAPAPRPVVLQAPKPVVLSAPQVSVNEAPQPYTFGFQSTDELGNTLSRSETADGSGTVTGSYSYLDAEGLTRVVEYVADAAGYRATVKTNEPGTANANPADVQVRLVKA